MDSEFKESLKSDDITKDPLKFYNSKYIIEKLTVTLDAFAIFMVYFSIFIVSASLIIFNFVKSGLKFMWDFLFKKDEGNKNEKPQARI